MNYQSIIKTYERNKYDLEYILCDIEPVLEALDANQVTDQTKVRETMLKFGQRVRKLIDQLIAIINRAFSSLNTTMVKVLQTDRGFADECRKIMIKKKPLEAVKLITFDYQEEFLQNTLGAWDNTIQKLLSGIKTNLRDERLTGKPEIMDLKTKDLEKEVLRLVGAPADVTSMSLYFIYLKKTFRKQKVEKLFKSSQIRNYYNITQSCKNLQTIINGKKTVMHQNVNRVKGNLQQIVTNTRVGDGIKKRVMRQASNASTLLNMYTSFLKAYTQLKTEHILTYRNVLRKLLRF